MNQKEFFNSMAEKWDSICHHDSDKINEILDFTDIPPGSRVLDVGTGTGVMVPFLVSRAGGSGEITAVDAAEKMIEIARGKHGYSNVSFIACDVFDFDFPPEHFDIIMCYSVFPHFESKPAAVKKLAKLLKPGGKIVICHSQSREQINSMHKRASRVVSEDNLPGAGVIEGYFSGLGFSTPVKVDDERMFVVIGQKKTS